MTSFVLGAAKPFRPAYESWRAQAYRAGSAFLSFNPTSQSEMSAPSTSKRLLEIGKNPPSSMEQVLHPEKYWVPERKDQPSKLRDDAVSEVIRTSAGSVIYKDTLGELLCALAVSEPGNRRRRTSRTIWSAAVAGWDGDRIYLVKIESADVATELPLAALWITSWDSARDREEFVDAYAKRARQ